MDPHHPVSTDMPINKPIKYQFLHLSGLSAPLASLFSIACRYNYLERNCCGDDVFDPSMTEPTCDVDPSGGDSDITITAVIVSVAVAAICALALLFFCARRFKRKNVKEDPVPKPQSQQYPGVQDEQDEQDEQADAILAK